MKTFNYLAGALLALIMFSTSLTNAQNWSLSGNSGTNPGKHFIGTKDNRALIFKTNGTSTTNERMRITGGGNVGIGITNPDSKLHIYSGADADLSAAGIFTIGNIANKNLVFDNDEIQSRGNGGAALLYLNRSNGNVWIGNDATAATSTPIIHTNSTNGNAGIGSTASANRLFINGSENNSDAVLRCKVNYSNIAQGTTIITKAISGISTIESAFGVGVYGEGTYQGIYGYATGSGDADHHGVNGYADGSGNGKHIGIYGSASGGSENYGGYFDTKVFANAIRIGTVGNEAETEVAGYKLSVDGKVICEEIKVQNSADWPDYVFADNYQLMPIDEMEKSIKENKHLPGIPSGCEVEENGLMIGEMQSKMMEKIEQLTLYIIELKHQKDDLANRLAKLENNK